MRPECLLVMPPVEVAAARLPSRSIATAPTVPNLRPLSVGAFALAARRLAASWSRATPPSSRTSSHWAWRPSVSKRAASPSTTTRSEEHTSELQSPDHLVCRLLLEKKKNDYERRSPALTTTTR